MSLWLGGEPLVLASQSRIRRTVLEAAAIPVEVCPADIDERAVEVRHGANGGAADASAIAARLAREKAAAVAAGLPGRIVLGADQTLAVDGKRLNKPANRQQAAEQLRTLRGRTHTLQSAVAVVGEGGTLFDHVSVAVLTMRDFSESFLQRYLDAAGESAMQSVGAYQLEGPGSQLFAQIDGDYFTVLGLPLLPLLDFLRRAKLLAV
jgi:septum formation protein